MSSTYCQHLPLRVHGFSSGILLWSSVLDYERQGMEGCCLPDCDTVSWNRLWNRFLCEFVHLEQTLEWSHTIHYHGGRGRDVVRYITTLGLPRILLWIQETSV